MTPLIYTRVWNLNSSLRSIPLQKMVKYDPKTEVTVWDAVDQLGEGTRPEILAFLKEQRELDIDAHTLLRYLFRWKAREVLTIATRGKDEVWKRSEVPPWFRLKMNDMLKLTDSTIMKAELKAIVERMKEAGKTIKGTIRKWGNFQHYSMTFECLDPILGGRVDYTYEEGENPHEGDGDADKILRFPRNADGKPFIPPSWLYGHLRDNIALTEDSGTHLHTAWGPGEFTTEVKPKQLKPRKLKAKVGFNVFESVAKGSRFIAPCRFPFRGSSIDSEEALKAFYDMLAISPIRGLGSYARAYGGRVKLVELKPLH